MGAAYTRNGERVGGTIGGSSVGAASGTGAQISDSTAAFTSGAGTDNVFSFGATGATSGIGILKKTGSAVLKLELDALESEGLGKTVSNPKLFTLDNQTASIKQGEQIPVSGGDGADTFQGWKKEAPNKDDRGRWIARFKIDIGPNHYSQYPADYDGGDGWAEYYIRVE